MSISDTDSSQDRLSRADRIRFFVILGALLGVFGSSTYLVWDSIALSNAFDQGVTQHLESASRAGTVETARLEINSAITFIQNDPYLKERLSDEDKASQDFHSWYRNLEITAQSLEKVDPDTTSIAERQIILNGVNRSLLTEARFGSREIFVPNNPEIDFPFSLGVLGLLFVFCYVLNDFFVFVTSTARPD